MNYTLQIMVFKDMKRYGIFMYEGRPYIKLGNNTAICLENDNLLLTTKEGVEYEAVIFGKKVGAIKPGDLNQIPDQVIEVFNEMITEYIDGHGVAEFKEADIIEAIKERMGVSGEEIKKNRWLFVGRRFGEMGWFVQYYHGSHYTFNGGYR